MYRSKVFPVRNELLETSIGFLMNEVNLKSVQPQSTIKKTVIELMRSVI